MPTPAQPSIYKSGSTELTSGGSINSMDFRKFGLTITSVTLEDMGGIKANREPRAGGHGDHKFPEYYESKAVILTGSITGDTIANCLTNIDALKTFIDSFRRDTPRRIRIIDPVRTDRYFLCYYVGPAQFTPIGPRVLADTYDIHLTLIADPPFAFGTTFQKTTVTSPAAGDFAILTTGTFESDARIFVKGAATNPKMIFGDSIFICDFDLNTTYTAIDKVETAMTFSGTDAQKAALFDASAFGLGYSFDLAPAAYSLTATVPGNKNAGTWFAIVEPNFNSVVDIVAPVFEHRGDANNYLILYYYNTSAVAGFERRWIANLYINGTNYWVATQSIKSFVAGEIFKVAVTYGSDGFSLYLEGVKDSASSLVTTALSTNPTTLTIGDTNGSSAFVANMKIHKLAGWSTQLTDSEHALIASDPDENIKNRNQILTHTRTLAAGDLLDFNRQDGKYIGKYLDISAGGAATTVFPDDGTVIPTLDANTTSVYFSTTMAEARIQWQNRYL